MGFVCAEFKTLMLFTMKTVRQQANEPPADSRRISTIHVLTNAICSFLVDDHLTIMFSYGTSDGGDVSICII
jgi:hypothetical protein